MRSIWKSLVLGMAGLVAAPIAALADDVEAQLKQMQDRMNQLEDRLQATTDQLEATEKKADEQQALIERSGIATGSGGASGLSAFVDSINVGGHVSTSYNYNFNRPDGAQLLGANGVRAFDRDADSFALDQLRLDIERPISADNRAGFRADIYYGRTARILNGLTGGGTAGNRGDDNEVHLAQAYIQYQEPFGDVQIKMGRFVTLLGAEVIESTGNFNISRGLLYTNAIPVGHNGVLAGRKYENGIEWALGVVNGWDASNGVDFNSSKSVTGRLAYAQEMWGVMLNGIYGNEQQRPRFSLGPNGEFLFGGTSVPAFQAAFDAAVAGGDVATQNALAGLAGTAADSNFNIGDERDERGVLDLILSFNPTENLKTYINVDAGWEQFDDDRVFLAFDPATNSFSTVSGQADDFWWGVSAAGRYAITERLGIALRGEYLRSIDSGAGSGDGVFALGPFGGASTIWGGTATLDYALTDHLMVRTEFRYDRADVQGDQNDQIFRGEVHDQRVTGHTNQQTVAAELIYKF